MVVKELCHSDQFPFPVSGNSIGSWYILLRMFVKKEYIANKSLGNSPETPESFALCETVIRFIYIR